MSPLRSWSFWFHQKMEFESSYRLKPRVQVRKERFGLLFYDYRGPRLYFVPSEELIHPDFFTGSTKVGDLIQAIRSQQGWPERWVRHWLSGLLEKLVERDLIYEQPLR